MFRITAKQLLSGKIFSTFFRLVFYLTVSGFGLALSVFAPIYLLNKNAQTVFGSRLGDYESVLRIALCALLIIIGITVFSVGRNLKAKRICGFVSDEKAVFSIKKSFQFLLYYAVKSLFTLCWGFIYLLPCALCVSFLVMSLSQGAMEKNIYYSWVTGCTVLFILGMFFTFVTLQRYSAWQYYLCAEDGSVISSLYKSLDRTSDRCFKIALFKLSMLGWILSCLSVFPVVYVLPYYNVSTALFVLDGPVFRTEKKREEIPPAVFRVIKDL